MTILKRFVFLFSIIVLTSCSDIESCYYAEDFGDIGNRDQVSIAARFLSCNYNTSLGIEDPVQSVNMTECLKTTTVSTAYTTCSEDEDCKNYASNKCSEIDPISDSTKPSFSFQQCVDYCVDICETNSTSDEQLWTKATIKTSTTYFGLEISPTSFITIQATGKISLSDSLKNKSSKYKKIGIKETDYSLMVTPLETYKLALQYKNDTLSQLFTKDKINTDVKTRTVLSVKNINSSLVDTTDNIGDSQKYRFQDPLFQYITCNNVKSKNEFGINELGGCYLDFSNDSNINSALISNLNSYYFNINTSLFTNGTYFMYATDILNNVNYMVEDTETGVYVPFLEKKDMSGPDILKMSSDGTKILFTNIAESTAAYLWNNDNSSFSINHDEPFKVAIRYIGNTAAECNYTASINNYYDIENQNGKKTVVNKTKTYNIQKVNFTAAGKEEGNKNTWNVLKTELGTNGTLKEILFNQFSTPIRSITSTFTLSTNDENCNKGLLIYIIPIKDYRPYDNGLLYFYVPHITSTQTIKYSIVNPSVINLDTVSLENPEKKLEEFYEHSKNYNAFGLNDTNNYTYRELSTVTPSDVVNIDKDNYSNLLNKSDFVRKNQIVRFDYSNWFTIDGKTSIETKETTYQEQIVDVAAIFNIIIKGQHPFVCFGEGTETMDPSMYCSNNNLGFEQLAINKNCIAKNSTDFTSIPNNCTEPTTSQDFCTTTKDYISACYVSNYKFDDNTELANKYIELIYSGSPLITEEMKKEQIEQIKNQTVSEFLSNQISSVATTLFYSDEIKFGDNNISISVENREEHEKLIEKTYEMARACLQDLINKKNDIVPTKDIVSKVGDVDATYKILYNFDSSVALDSLLPNTKENKLIVLTTKEKFEKMRDVFLTKTVTKVNKINDDGTINENEFTTNTSYNNTFKIYKIVNKNNLSISKTQCYNLENFVGSTKQFLLNTKNNTETVNVTNYGNASKDYITMGIEKIPNFSSNSAGNIDNFTVNTSFDNWNPDLNCNNNCTALDYNGKINSTTNYTLTLNIINKLTDDQINSYDSQFINSFSYKENGDIIFATRDSITEYNSNGDRLSVILGEDSVNYKGDIINNLNGDIKGVTDNSTFTASVFTEGATDSSQKYYPLVYYLESSPNSSEYHFDENGLLTDLNNISAIDIKNHSLINKYITASNTQKNIFFKITDTDENSANNSGKYSVVIKEYTENDYDSMVDMFRLFFQSVLTFIDGNSISLLSINDSAQEIVDRFAECEEVDDKTKVSCHVYQPGSENHGKMCSPKDTNCFIDCLGQNDGKCFKFNDGKGFVKMVYKTIITNPLYILIIKISLILSIAIYGFGYFFGLTKFKQSEIIGKIIKLCFVYFMASASGWEFFDKFIATFFKNGIDSILFLIASSFETNLASEVMQAVETHNYSDKIVLFSGAMDNLELLISMPVFSKIVGLFFSGWVGPVYFYFVMTTVLTYIVAVISSIIIYLSIQVYMSLVFCFFPLVIIFMLFKKSEGTFTNWLSILIGFAGQQILLITTLSFFNMLIYNFIKTTFAYTVCWLPLLNIKLGGFPLFLISFYKIPNTGISSTGINMGGEAMPSFYAIITFYMIGSLMGKFITSMTSLGNSIFGGKMDINSSPLTSKITGLAEGVKGKADSFMKQEGLKFYNKMGGIMGGNYIKREGTSKLQERRKKEEDFRKELNNRTTQSLSEKKSSEEYKQKKENIINKSRNQATVKEFEKDKDFINAYNQALGGKEDDGTNQEANKLVQEKLYSSTTTDAQRNSIGKRANVSTKHEINKLDRELEKEARSEESRKMLTETDKDGNATQFNLVNQLMYESDDKDKSKSLVQKVTSLDQEQFEDLAKTYSIAHGYSPKDEKPKPEERPTLDSEYSLDQNLESIPETDQELNSNSKQDEEATNP